MRKTASVIALAAGCGLLTASALASARQAPPPNVFRASYTVDIDYVDPALSYYAPAWALHYATGAWLFNYPDAPAPRGARLVPEVALGFPRVSKDGKTYTFRLKKTYRFSNGRRVSAASFVRAFQRARNKAMKSPAAQFLADVRSIRVLGPYTLRLRLERPAGDLLARLAMPFFMAVPANTPIDPEGIRAPVISAGPYFISSWTRNRGLVLERNRFYRGPRPRRVRRIVVDVGLPLETIKLRIDQGQTDTGDIPPRVHAELGRRHGVRRRSPGRYFVNPTPHIIYLAMNHEQRLFGGPTSGGNVRLKRAVSFALDRRAMVAEYGAFGAVPYTDLIPPPLGGGKGPPLYPARPDLQRARALASGHLRGGKGAFDCRRRAPFPQMCQIAQANLRRIGLDLDIRLFPPCVGCDEHYKIRGEPFDATVVDWRADYLDPYGFLFLVDGTTIRPRENTNLSYVNHGPTNRRIAEARRLAGEARDRAFRRLARAVMRELAPLAVVGARNERRYVSARTGCYHHHPVYGLDLPAICVRG
jgi:ABC-type oligopeptide transport system substrate-binding subunit